MVLTFSKLALANAAIALVLVPHADASPLTVNPVTLLPTVSILNNQNPAFGGPPSRDMVRVAVFEDPTLTRAEVYEEIAKNTTSSSPSTTSSTPNASGFDASSSPTTVPTSGSGITSSPPPANTSTSDRRLEVTSVDVQRLEEHFQQSMVVNLNTIKQLYNKAGFQPAPWPSGYWPTYQDSINAKWDGSQPSPAEKYAKAYGLDVKTFMDKVSRYNGIDTQIGTPSCTSNSQCASRNDGSVCAKRTGATTGYCVAKWWGICHAWAPAAILEREPRCNVVKNGVTFKPFDIKGLITAAYDGSYIPVVFTGARYDGAGSPRDEYGRLTDAKERDLGPGYFHIAVTNIMGRYKMSFVVDVASGAPVWNQPVRSYEITETTEMTPAAAAMKYFNVPKYPFNDAAKSIAFVRMTFRYINEMVRDGPLVETGIVDQATLTNYYTYLLELDAQKNIIGGEWVYGSQTNHPDFLWFATQKPAANAVTAVGISYQNVVDLLQQSIACGTTPTPTTPTPTTPTPTTPTPTTPTPTTPTPTTPTPTTPTPTTPTPTTSSPPASGGPCGNALVGPQPCPVGEYCQPWDPWFYQCRKVDAKCGVQEVGVDFYGDDLASFQLLLPEQCCDKCVATTGCKAYTFVNYNADGKAYCYLKKGTGQKSNKAGVVSATIATTTTPTPTTPTPTTMSPPASGGPCGNAQVGPQPCPVGEYCQPWDPWFYQCRKLPAKCGVQEVGVDYYGDDLASFQLLLPEDCCEKCAATVGCKAYTFVNYNADGKAYCYLKKGSGIKSNKAGVVSAMIAASPPPTCPTPAWGNCGNGAAGASCCPSGFYCQPWDALYYQCIQSPAKCSRQFAATDFYGDDLAVVYGIGPGECCDKCAATVGCKAYTFVNNNVPTPACYLKKGSGQQRTNPSAVSALLN